MHMKKNRKRVIEKRLGNEEPCRVKQDISGTCFGKFSAVECFSYSLKFRKLLHMSFKIQPDILLQTFNETLRES